MRPRYPLQVLSEGGVTDPQDNLPPPPPPRSAADTAARAKDDKAGAKQSLADGM